MKHYFTFGADHVCTRAGVTDPLRQYITVEGPKSAYHRGLFIEWLGSNKFAFEYDEEEFEGMAEKYGLREAVRITITINEEER